MRYFAANLKLRGGVKASVKMTAIQVEVVQ